MLRSPSATITSDKCFCEMLRKYWGVAEESEQAATKADLKSIIKLLRYKLITSTTGTQDEYLMKNNFRSRLGTAGVTAADAEQADRPGPGPTAHQRRHAAGAAVRRRHVRAVRQGQDGLHRVRGVRALRPLRDL